ncbi:multicopper oxidase family protein [Arthrobacter sp. CJ23]|uniref:multicopper oxidase family protein n=1 Tax=Arthrobacter sp. CJ23 TaxID=2972479 RepID=UPI00215CCDE5|nr:multicopper oxidase family protein [Arthrobacter sp. CJ23]UVJ41256.1 multicopper oxidase family protein [Arthrobacter sp. CJ23]
MQPVSRRTALLLGGLGLAGMAAGGTGLFLTLTSRPTLAVGDELTQPSILQSSDGRLEVRLEAGPGRVKLAGQPASALAYNGEIPGPTLRVRPGDVLKVSLVNNLGGPTNLHMHGLHVSPQGNGDNVFVRVGPGSTFDYEYRLPADHPPGVYWYHPHRHGLVADQIFAGLFGAIIVEDPAAIEVSRERVLVVSDTTLDALGDIQPTSGMDRMAGRQGQLLLVNGQLNPRLEARPGERERWRIINACVTRYLRLGLDGQHLELLGMDSGRLRQRLEVKELLLTPGNRADLLVNTATGDSVLRTTYYDRGAMPGMMGRGGAGAVRTEDRNGAPLVTLRVVGDSGRPLPSLAAGAAPVDLRSSAVAARRQLTLGIGTGMAMGMMGFTIDGRQFNDARTDTIVAAGSVEEWTLVNTSPMDHPFHLHVWPMQIIEENGQAVDSVRRQDVVNLPANGRVKVRVAFDDFTGRSVYHCHILDHEDLGMMGVIEVR